MSLSLYAHPFSSYSQKVLIALYENDTPFLYRTLDAEHPTHFEALKSYWRIGKFPLLEDGSTGIWEATIIIEYLDLHYPGPRRMLPLDPRHALDVRLLDRIFDNYVMTPMNSLVMDRLRPPDRREPMSVTQARAMLDNAYAWLDARLKHTQWGAGADFTLVDCAAAPSLFYADWVHEIPARYDALKAYRARLLARPSVARAVEEARPYRSLFPGGAPARD